MFSLEEKEKDTFLLKVPSQNFSYRIIAERQVPQFMFIPLDKEVIYRIIIKAALTQSPSELNLKMSAC